MKNNAFLVISIFIVFTIVVSKQISSSSESEQVHDHASDKFKECCEEKNVSCSEICSYPPPDFTIGEQFCLLKCNSDFISCYTGGNNNTKCCAEHGVVGIYGICQDFCDGTDYHDWDPRYVVCGPVKKIISKCNRDSIKNRTF
ncbi:DB domain-containing protein [Meloidogyne graminicola]|uniref:DB domain-containing protein n=1 Tax=Meloidogyne graminicola TaxID=189291 RepID=A0A8S9ZFE1_9BILA|nr:DB domain-containing protein [Meloidogyne graminicola]